MIRYGMKDFNGKGIFLTERRYQVLKCIVAGMSASEIAGALTIERSTAATHINVLLKLTACKNKVQLAVLAVRQEKESY